MQHDLFNNSVPLEDQIACVEREIEMRRMVYAKQIRKGKMKPVTAEREIESMEAVLHTLQQLCPLTGALHRAEIYNDTASCHDCMAVLPTPDEEPMRRWKCQFCELTVGELNSV